MRWLRGFTVENFNMNLDELQKETERPLALLKDRQPGIMTWNDFMRERLQSVVDLAASAGIRPGGGR